MNKTIKTAKATRRTIQVTTLIFREAIGRIGATIIPISIPTTNPPINTLNQSDIDY
jgi:hypothetical protein